MKPKAARNKILQPRFRILRGHDIAIGPGKAELLEHLRQTGSIAEAAKRMNMSYMRAWLLIKTMNQCYKQPLIQTLRGGAAGGGTEVTETGRKVLQIYRQMEKKCFQATKPSWEQMQKLLRD
jgi:molybdate transport system regulatory protein